MLGRVYVSCTTCNSPVCGLASRFTFRNVKIQLAQKHRMLESYSSEEEDESDLVEPARESQMEDLRVDANLLP